MSFEFLTRASADPLAGRLADEPTQESTETVEEHSASPLHAVLITGASSGIGLLLAREFARHRHILVITASSAAELEKVADQLRQEFNVSILPIAKDLRDERSTEELFQEIKAAGLVVSILAGNAGVFPRNRFDN